MGPLAPTHQIITQIFWTKSESTPACLSGNLSFIAKICDTLRFTPSVSSWIKHRSTLFIDLNMVMLCQSSMTRSWVVQRSCAGGRVWLSSLWQQKLLVGGTVLGRGRSRNSAPTHGTGGERGCPPPLGSSGNSAAAGQRCDSGKQGSQLPTTTSWKNMIYFLDCTVPDTIKCTLT